MAATKVVSRFEESLLCPITCDLLRDPVVAPDGYTYERRAIEQWLQVKQSSPMTRKPMKASQLVPNLHMRHILEELEAAKQEQRKAKKQAAAAAAQQDDTSSSAGLPQRDIDRLTSAHDLTMVNLHAHAVASLRTVRPTVVAALDDLSDMVGNIDFQPPQIVVLGTESHGKSTILERLAGLPIFPRDKRLCTRVPIRVRLRRGEAQCIRMWQQELDEKGRPIVSIKDLLSSAELVPGLNVLAKVRETMHDIIAQLNEDKKQNGVSLDREIVVQLTGPTYPEIDLVDLPGLVAMAAGDEDPELPAKTLELTKRYLQQHGDHSMFIVALDSRHEMHTSAAVRLLSEYKALDRALGVYTKCDLYQTDEDSDDEDGEKDDPSQKTSVGRALTRLVCPKTNERYVACGYGWMLLSSRGLPRHSKTFTETEADPFEGLARCEQQETAFFRSQGLSPAEGTGVQALCLRIVSAFESYLVRRWVPEVLQRLRNASQKVLTETVALGVPFQAQPAVEATAIEEVCSADISGILPRVQHAIVSILSHETKGTWAQACLWYVEQLKPLQERLMAVQQTPSPTLTDNIPSQVLLRQQRVEINAVRDAALELSHSLRETALQDDTKLHPVAQTMYELIQSHGDEDRLLQLARFENAIVEIARALSQLMKQWSHRCALHIDCVADEILSSGLAQPTTSQDAETVLKTKCLASILENETVSRGSLVQALINKSYSESDNILAEEAKLVQKAVIGKCLIDNNTKARHDLLMKYEQLQNSIELLSHAVVEMVDDRLRGLVSTFLSGESSSPEAFFHRQKFTRPLRRCNLRNRTINRLTHVFDGTCGSSVSFLDESFGLDAAVMLALAVRRKPPFTSLHIAHCQIGAEGAMLLARGLKGHPEMRILSIEGNNLGDDGAVFIAGLLQTNTNLETINIRSNNIGLGGAMAFGHKLQSNSTLKKLYLGNNAMGSIACQLLCRMLEFNTKLATLDLGGNPISDGGAKALGEALVGTTGLECLSLQRCGIGLEGGIAIAKGFALNQTLKYLNLNNNKKIGDEGMIHFKLLADQSSRSGATGRTRKKLFLKYNKMSKATVEALSSLEDQGIKLFL